MVHECFADPGSGGQTCATRAHGGDVQVGVRDVHVFAQVACTGKPGSGADAAQALNPEQQCRRLRIQAPGPLLVKRGRLVRHARGARLPKPSSAEQTDSVRTQHRHDLHGGKAGLAQASLAKGGDAHEAVRALLPAQVAVRKQAQHLQLDGLDACLLTWTQCARLSGTKTSAAGAAGRARGRPAHTGRCLQAQQAPAARAASPGCRRCEPRRPAEWDSRRFRGTCLAVQNRRGVPLGLRPAQVHALQHGSPVHGVHPPRARLQRTAALRACQHATGLPVTSGHMLLRQITGRTAQSWAAA